MTFNTNPRPKRCALCERITVRFPAWDKKRWACAACWKDYVAYRRSYRAEFGFYPSVARFRMD